MIKGFLVGICVGDLQVINCLHRGTLKYKSVIVLILVTLNIHFLVMYI